MNAEFFDALDALEKTKGIPKEYMLERVEAALCSAYKKEKGQENVRVVLDPEKKDVRVFSQQTVVAEVTDPEVEISVEQARKISKKYKEGDIVETEVKTKSFGRLSAQTAKQVIIQGIREAERSNIIKEYEKKREEVVTAQVAGIEIMDLDDAVQTLWKAGIYAESGMGCTGPIVLMSEANHDKAVEELKKAGYIQ